MVLSRPILRSVWIGVNGTEIVFVAGPAEWGGYAGPVRSEGAASGQHLGACQVIWIGLQEAVAGALFRTMG